MDDVTKLEMRKKILVTADQLQVMPVEQRVRTFDAMADRALELDHGPLMAALDFNARLVSELRIRNINLPYAYRL